MKKILILLLAGMMLFSFVSCDEPKPDDGPAIEKPGEDQDQDNPEFTDPDESKDPTESEDPEEQGPVVDDNEQTDNEGGDYSEPVA